MHYKIKATKDGYQLSWVGNGMNIVIEEFGGHGAIEKLYADADKTFELLRQQAVAERKAK